MTKTAAPIAYHPLARRYRPARFAELIGQDVVVRTLANAFKHGRLDHAYIFTGVRGTGKTTSARLLARNINYVAEEAGTAPTSAIPFDPPDWGRHCRAILEARHVDVVEIDAASHTGVDSIRDVIEHSRYMPAMAPCKVYIIDEVHMLSRAAFNALLKTLEEPPPHVKFIFATTEIAKVPVTILSRCQRFNLRRIDADTLKKHLIALLQREGVSAEDEALNPIIAVAGGSVRDALSILDQAIAFGDGMVRVEAVRMMLGVADNGPIVALFEDCLSGKIASALQRFDTCYHDGADPVIFLQAMATLCYDVTRCRFLDAATMRRSLAEADYAARQELAQRFSMPVLALAWQMLIKGASEAAAAIDPRITAEMVLVRLACAAELPSPIGLTNAAIATSKPPDSVKPPSDPTPSLPDPVASLPEPVASSPDPATPPPDPVASPPDPTPSLPDPVASPPEPVASPSDPTPSLPDLVPPPPDPVASPPDPVASPPDPVASLPDLVPPPPDPVASPPDPTPSPPDPAPLPPEPVTPSPDSATPSPDPVPPPADPDDPRDHPLVQQTLIMFPDAEIVSPVKADRSDRARKNNPNPPILR